MTRSVSSIVGGRVVDGSPGGRLAIPNPARLDEAVQKAQDAIVLDLAEICSFTDYFVICTGTSTRQNQTIAETIEETLRKDGVRPLHIEGHTEGEWILLDYVDFVVHIFSARAREFYDLERLWRAGKRRDAHELIAQRAL